jgi:hypothetical protein
MNSGEKFNQFAQQNGASVLYQDENLVMQKELKQEIVYWGSVYGSEFVEMPDNVPTSEPAYRTWCWKSMGTGMMPAKRSPTEFDKYIRPKMLAASARPTLAGTEYGAEVEDAMDSIFEYSRGIAKDLDEKGVGAWFRGDMLLVETLPDSTNGKELIIKIKPFMRKINTFESFGKTQGHIKRSDVCKRLAHYGRQIAGRDASVERLRCAYALPIEVLYEGFDAVEGK